MRMGAGNHGWMSHSLKLRIDLTMTSEQLADPNFPEGPRDESKIYALPEGYKFCAKVINTSPYRLKVTLFNCSAGGLVEYLSDELLREGAAQVMWLDNELGSPFVAGADELPTDNQNESLTKQTTERMIAIGTTRRDISLDYLQVAKRVQEVVDENIVQRVRGEGDKSLRSSPKTPIAPAELWTATITPFRIRRQ
jgi:hypothetical protein